MVWAVECMAWCLIPSHDNVMNKTEYTTFITCLYFYYIYYICAYCIPAKDAIAKQLTAWLQLRLLLSSYIIVTARGLSVYYTVLWAAEAECWNRGLVGAWRDTISREEHPAAAASSFYAVYYELWTIAACMCWSFHECLRFTVERSNSRSSSKTITSDTWNSSEHHIQAAVSHIVNWQTVESDSTKMTGLNFVTYETHRRGCLTKSDCPKLAQSVSTVFSHYSNPTRKWFATYTRRFVRDHCISIARSTTL